MFGPAASIVAVDGLVLTAGEMPRDDSESCLEILTVDIVLATQLKRAAGRPLVACQGGAVT
jgi:hypothetical protein